MHRSTDLQPGTVPPSSHLFETHRGDQQQLRLRKSAEAHNLSTLSITEMSVWTSDLLSKSSIITAPLAKPTQQPRPKQDASGLSAQSEQPADTYSEDTSQSRHRRRQKERLSDCVSYSPRALVGTYYLFHKLVTAIGSSRLHMDSRNRCLQHQISVFCISSVSEVEEIIR